MGNIKSPKKMTDAELKHLTAILMKERYRRVIGDHTWYGMEEVWVNGSMESRKFFGDCDWGSLGIWHMEKREV